MDKKITHIITPLYFKNITLCTLNDRKCPGFYLLAEKSVTGPDYLIYMGGSLDFAYRIANTWDDVRAWGGPFIQD
ncbi:MAG: hypothetical protein LBP92_05900 [Deltaproteobacteria bacterium]|jgi:hypothetical protein|nr:hypothetical protein [Deltaproteobacteria bacterium]